MPPLMVRCHPTPIPPLMVRCTIPPMPPLMVRGGVEQSETEGIRGSETEQTIPQSCSACQLPLHKGAMVVGRVRRDSLYASPYEMRSISRKERELRPRERKNLQCGAGCAIINT